MIAPFLIALLAAAPGAAAADSARDSVLVMPEVRVDRARAPSPAERRAPTAFTTTLAAGEHPRALETLGDLLREATGVHVTQYGGLGAFATVSLRGAPPGQVSVYLDGTPMTSAAGSVVNLADLPFTPVERVEVYRGSSPLAFGGATPGGAINLVSRSRPEVRELRVTRGSFGTWESRASGGVRRGAFSALLHAGYQGSRGDFRFDDDNGTPFNAADDSVSARANNRLDAANALALLAWNAGGLHVAARQHFFHRAGGVPGLGAAPALHPRETTARTLTQFEVTDRGARLRPRLALRASLGRDHSRFTDTAGELGTGRHDTDQRFASEQLSLETEWPSLPRWVLVEGAGSLRGERADLSDRADGLPEPPRSRRTTRGAMAGVRLRPLGERLVLRAARRWDRVEDRLRSVQLGGVIRASDASRVLDSPQLGAVLRPHAGIELRANWADASRPPDFVELFGNQGSVIGNPALQEERSENWDAGGRLEARRAGAGFAAAVEYAHFVSHARDLILYVRNSQSSVKAQNISAARIEGDELSLRLATPWRVRASAGMTWEDARDAGTFAPWRGKQLPQRPARQLDARLDAALGPFRAAADLQVIEGNALDRYNRYLEASRTLAGASLSWTPARGPLRLTLEGTNLGDHRVSDVGGFPLPGRGMWLACEYRLGPAESASMERN